MTRFLLADRFGFTWDNFKNDPAHFIKQLINDIERSKNHFKGFSSRDVRKFASDAQTAGISLT